MFKTPITSLKLIKYTRRINDSYRLSWNKILLPVLFGVFMLVSANASTISVSEIDYIETEDEFYENHVLTEFQVDGTGEKLHYKLDSNTISDEIDEASTDSDLEISAQIQDVRAEYSVEDRNLRQLIAPKIVREEFQEESEAHQWAQNNCLDLKGDTNADYEYFSSSHIWPPLQRTQVSCAIEHPDHPVYNVGYLQNPPDATFEVKWTVNADGEEEIVVISNKGVKEGENERIGEHTQIEFLSLEDRGADAPNPQNTLVAYSSQTGWMLIEEQEYYNYVEYFEDEVLRSIENGVNQPDGIEYTALDDWKNYETERHVNKFQESTQEYIESAIHGADTPEVNESNIYDGVWTYRPSSELGWFTSSFLIRTDAEFLGVEKDFAEVEIVSKEGVEVEGLQNSEAEIIVENTGDGTGRLEGRTKCENFTTSGTSIVQTVEPEERATFHPILSADGSEELEDDCEFVIEDKETSETWLSSFKATYTPAKECSSGSYIVRSEEGDQVIYRCSENGVDLIEVDRCTEGEEVAKTSQDGYKCEKVEDRNVSESLQDCRLSLFPERLGKYTGANYQITNPLCLLEKEMDKVSMSVSNLLFVFETLFALFAGLIGWAVSNKYFKKVLEVFSLTDKYLLKLILSLTTAMLFSIMAYTLISYWWAKILVVVMATVVLYFLPTLNFLLRIV